MKKPIVIEGTERPEPKARIIRPTKLLIIKYYIELVLIFVAVNVAIILFILFVDFMKSTFDDPSSSSLDLSLVISTFSPFYLLIWLIIFILVLTIVPLYVRSMIFSVHGSELVVKKGIINKTVKHVPYRAVTNLDTVAGLIDRLLGIGNVKIQTAGKSGPSSSGAAEENMEGLKMYNEVRDYIVRCLKNIVEPSFEFKKVEDRNNNITSTKSDILSELREIKEIIKNEKKN